MADNELIGRLLMMLNNPESVDKLITFLENTDKIDNKPATFALPKNSKTTEAQTMRHRLNEYFLKRYK